MVCCTYEEDRWADYLAHHGIIGQKWGVRRYQNPDGSLTALGRERYGKSGQKEYSGTGAIRKNLTDPFRMTKLGGHRATRLGKKAAKLTEEGDEKRAAKAKRKAEAQDAANANRQAWDNRQKTSKLAASQGTRGLANLINSLSFYPLNPEAFMTAFSQVMSGSISTGALQELANVATVFNPAQMALNTVVNNGVVAPNYKHARARRSGVVRSILESGAGVEPIGSILRYKGDKDAYGALTWWS